MPPTTTPPTIAEAFVGQPILIYRVTDHTDTSAVEHFGTCLAVEPGIGLLLAEEELRQGDDAVLWVSSDQATTLLIPWGCIWSVQRLRPDEVANRYARRLGPAPSPRPGDE